MSSDDGKLLTYGALGFVAGVYWFFKGFRIYREYHVLEDTPEIPIRSIPMGLVEIHGKATGEETVNSPVSQSPCLFYKVDIEKWIQDKNGGHWSHYATDADGPKFYLEDGTGKVLVDAHRAEYDLLQTAQQETGGSGSLNLGSLFGGRPAISRAGASATDLMSYVSRVGAQKHSSFSTALGSGGISMALGGISLGGGSSGRYRLREFLILPEHWYDVTGTCVENPNPKDDHDRNMIVKGQNEPTFLITWRNKAQEESLLRRRAMKYIFGGGALSVACLALLLAKLGWL